MRAIRKAFNRRHALQCGFCTPGMLATAYDILSRIAELDRERIRTELGGNFCRCTGYLPIIQAIEDVHAQRAQSAVRSRQSKLRNEPGISQEGDQREQTHSGSIEGKSSPPGLAHSAPAFCRAPRLRKAPRSRSASFST